MVSRKKPALPSASAKKRPKSTGTSEERKDTRFGGKDANPRAVHRQFGGENANPSGHGFWKKEATARFKLEKMMLLKSSELNKIANDPDAPLFERKLAESIYRGNWQEISQMINQVYGYPMQKVEQTNFEGKPLVDLTGRKKNGENDGAEQD